MPPSDMNDRATSARRARLLTLAAIVSTVCAVYVVLTRVRAEWLADTPGPRTETVEDWREYGLEGHRMGPANAPVTIVNFSDFECRFCARQAPALKVIRQRFGDQVAVVYRHVPGLTPEVGRPAAIASECAALNGFFEVYHDALFRQQDWLVLDPWITLAQEVGGADADEFASCLSDPAAAARVNRDTIAAAKLGVDATPTLLINGLKVVGYTPADTLAIYVEASLAAEERRPN